MPGLECFYATDHDGRIWISNYDGNIKDVFDEDVGKNNPIWIAQSIGERKEIFAWANGIVRLLLC